MSKLPSLQIAALDGPAAAGWAAFTDAAPRPPRQALEQRLGHFAGYGRCCHLLALRGGRVVGRLSAILNSRTAPGEGGASVGFLGHLLAPPEPEARHELMRAALDWLSSQGVGVVRAPVNLSTWYENRLPVRGSARPPFFGEPPAEPAVAAWLAEQGFAPCWSYASAEVPALEAPLPGWAGWVGRFTAAGGRLRTFDPARAEQELALLHRLSQQAFAGNFSFSPIDLAEFGDLYRPLLPALLPELALFALDRAGEEVGFCFTFPDPGAPHVLLVKTLGVLPRARGSGAGTALVAAAHERGAALGLRSAVHVLMNQASASRAISAHGGRIFREYALFGREVLGRSLLAPARR